MLAALVVLLRNRSIHADAANRPPERKLEGAADVKPVRRIDQRIANGVKRSSVNGWRRVAARPDGRVVRPRPESVRRNCGSPRGSPRASRRARDAAPFL